MDLIIKGQDLPTSCRDCPCLNDEYWFCQADARPADKWAARPDWCPLVPLPPHGRLIDADALCERLLTAWHTADSEGRRIIGEVMADVVTPIVVSTPTIIPAEEGEE